MTNTFEIKNKSIDLTDAVLAKDIADLQAELLHQKDELEKSKTEKEAQKFLENVPFYADQKSRTLQIGDKYIQAKDQNEYDSYFDQITKSIEGANAEIAVYLQKLQKDEANVADDTKKKMETVKSSVRIPVGKEAAETNETYPTFDNLTLLQKAFSTYHDGADKDEAHPTREDKRLHRQTERYKNARSDKQRARIAKREDKLSEKIADRRADAADHLANAADNTVDAKEMQNQSWYYNDIINALTADPTSNRIHYLPDHTILIDTYHPLFESTDNFKGTIMLTHEAASAYKTQAEKNPDHDPEFQKHMDQMEAAHPGAKAQYEKGGLIGMLLGAGVEHTNMRSKDAVAIANITRMATTGALLFFGVRSILDLIRGGKTKGEKDRRTRALWTLGIMAAAEVGTRAAFGAGLNELLTKGDFKKNRDKMCDTFGFSNMHFDNLDKKSAENIIYNSTVNSLLVGISWKDQQQFIVKESDGSCSIDEEKYKTYLAARSATDAEFAKGQQKRLDNLDVLKSAGVTKNAVTKYYLAIGFNPFTVEAGKMNDTPEKEFIETETIKAKLVQKVFGYKYDDNKLASYVNTLRKNNRNGDDVTVQELQGAGIITGVNGQEILSTDTYDKAVFDSLITAGVLDETDAKKLTKSRQEMVDILKKKNPNAEHEIRFETDGTTLYLHSHGWKTNITKSGSDRTIGSFDHRFPDAYHALRVANLVNFLASYKGTVSKDVKVPFTYNGNNLKLRQHTAWTDLQNLNVLQAVRGTTVVDGPDGFSSSLEEIGGTDFQTQAGTFAAWLNSLKGADGKTPLRYEGNGAVTPDNSPTAIIVPPVASPTGPNDPANPTDPADNPADKKPDAPVKVNKKNESEIQKKAEQLKLEAEKKLREAKEWTKEKWELFKKDMVSIEAHIKQREANAEIYFKQLFGIDQPHGKDINELKEKIKIEKAQLKEWKLQLSLLEKLDKIKRDEIAEEKERGEMKVKVEEDSLMLDKIESQIDMSVDPALMTTHKAQELKDNKRVDTDRQLLNRLGTDEKDRQKQKEELTRAEKKVNFELHFNSSNDEAKFVVMRDDTLYLESCGGQKTKIRYYQGKYYLDKFMVAFDDAESVVRMANLTNFLKHNFENRVTTNVEKPWYIANNGDLKLKDKSFTDALKKGNIRGMFTNLTILDGEDGFSSAIKKMGGETFESQKAVYADYLNTIKNVGGENLRVMKDDHGVVPEILKPLGEKFAGELEKVKRSRMPSPETPATYHGKSTLLDKNATIETVSGYVTLSSHDGHRINIMKDESGKYKLGYINSIDKGPMKMTNTLDIPLTTEEEALRLAMLINFYRTAYKGLGATIRSGKGDWNVAKNGDIEFAQMGAHFDATALTLADSPSFGLNTRADRITLCIWLDALKEREKK